jgi:hypothetical protein
MIQKVINHVLVWVLKLFYGDLDENATNALKLPSSSSSSTVCIHIKARARKRECGEGT